MKRLLLSLSIMMLPMIALAQEHGEAGGHEVAHAEGIPTVVYLQAINFLLYAALLWFFLRKPVREYFTNRVAAYKSALVKAEAARKEAEERRREIQQRLNQLESTSQASVAQARAEADALRARIVADAQALSTNLQEEARRTATAEIERAKTQLREELTTQAIEASRKVLSEKVSEQDQKRLQSEFVDKIQEVR